MKIYAIWNQYGNRGTTALVITSRDGCKFIHPHINDKWWPETRDAVAKHLAATRKAGRSIIMVKK